MSLLDSQPEATALSKEDLIILLTAVVRAYGMQEANGRGSKVIVDQYEAEAAYQILRKDNFKVHKLEPGAITIFDKDDRTRQAIDRYVIEVIE